MTASLLGVIGILASGCATSHNFATLSNGACSAFPAPKYQIKGQTSYDQKWADKTTEAGVAGCDWKRPAKRPASLNPKPVAAKLEPDPAPTTFKKRWYDRFLKHRAAQ
jgi:hypothetical protein